MILLAAVWSGALLGAGVPRSQWWICAAGVSLVMLLAAALTGLCHQRAGPGQRHGRLVAAAAVAAWTVSGWGAAVRSDAVHHGPLATRATERVAVAAELTAVSDARDAGHGQRWVFARLSLISWGATPAVRSRERVVVRLPSEGLIAFGASYRFNGVAAPLGDSPSAHYYRRLGAVVGLDPISLVQTRAPPRWQRAATQVRTSIARAAHDRLPPERAALLTGLVTGDLTGQSEQVGTDFRTAGLSHLVAVSGSNVAIVAAGTMALALLVGLDRRTGWWISLGLVWWFVVMVRADPSVLRAAVMASLVFAAMLVGRVRSAVHLLSTAGMLVLLGDPMLAGRLGFVLSMAATAGVLLVAPSLQRGLASHTALPRGTRTVLAATCGAQLAVAPILIAGGGAVHPASLPANLVAVPTAAVASMIGAVAAVVSVVSVPFAGVMAWVTSPLLGVILVVARMFASSSGRHVATIATGVVAALVVVRLRGLLGLSARRAMIGVLAALAVTSVGAGVHRLQAPPGWPDAPMLTVVDVGQGDALLLGDPVGGWMLVDAGPDPVGMASVLADMGITSLSAAVTSHADADHVGGMATVLRALPVGLLIIGPLGDEATAVLSAATAVGTSVRTVSAGDRWRHGTMSIQVLSPPAVGLGLDRNDNSMMLRVDVDGGRSVLLSGDAEELPQTLLLDQPLIDVDVLKVPHHGGNTNADGFLRATTPDIAVISVGQDNDFGHPHPDVLADLAGVSVRRTDLDGTIQIPLGPP
ncbi:ComEC/Rec2 family competence protein [soil metagenome]